MKQKKCKNCKGKGYVPVYFTMASRARGIEECPVCKGTGKVESGDKEERKMTKEELKNKCTERAKIFQQAMESCHSSSPMDCIEWFADRIADLEKENAELKEKLKPENCLKLLAKDGYVKFTSDQLTKAKKIIRNLLTLSMPIDYAKCHEPLQKIAEAEQFLKENK